EPYPRPTSTSQLATHTLGSGARKTSRSTSSPSIRCPCTRSTGSPRRRAAGQPKGRGRGPAEDHVAPWEPRVVETVDQVVLDALVEAERRQVVQAPDPVARQRTVDEVDLVAPPGAGV